MAPPARRPKPSPRKHVKHSRERERDIYIYCFTYKVRIHSSPMSTCQNQNIYRVSNRDLQRWKACQERSCRNVVKQERYWPPPHPTSVFPVTQHRSQSVQELVRAKIFISTSWAFKAYIKGCSTRPHRHTSKTKTPTPPPPQRLERPRASSQSHTALVFQTGQKPVQWPVRGVYKGTHARL